MPVKPLRRQWRLLCWLSTPDLPIISMVEETQTTACAPTWAEWIKSYHSWELEEFLLEHCGTHKMSKGYGTLRQAHKCISLAHSPKLLDSIFPIFILRMNVLCSAVAD